MNAFSFKFSPNQCFPATRSLYVVDDYLHSHIMLSNQSDVLLLVDLPEMLWAKDKYDVGLIRNCDPVTITPKSEYRPCKQWYPVRQEAVDRIRPVFASLLQAGVIIPCPDSPVHTPLFPVKKIRVLYIGVAMMWRWWRNRRLTPFDCLKGLLQKVQHQYKHCNLPGERSGANVNLFSLTASTPRLYRRVVFVNLKKTHLAFIQPTSSVW